MIILMSENREAVVAAEQQIRLNAGIPDGKGTEKWSDIYENSGLFYIIAPQNEGWNGISKAQLLNNVLNVVEGDIDPPSFSE